jgi:hypothetical protein
MADTDTPHMPEAPDPSSGQSDAVAETKALVLDRLARSEDASNYIAERADLEKEEETGEVETGAARAQRIREALEEARRDTNEARAQEANGLDQQMQDAQAQWEYQQAEEQRASQLLESARNEGKFQERATLLKQQNPQVWQEITDTLGTFDALAASDQQIDILKAGLTRNPEQGMAMAWRLSQPSYNPDGTVLMTPAQKMEHLASLSPQELASTLEQARLFVQIEEQVSRQYAQRYAAQPKRMTSAPPVMSQPRGAANPPKDMASLARKDNASDYIKARMAQEKRASE